MNELPILRLGTGWVDINIQSEADVALTARGYAPVLRVQDAKTRLDYLMYIGARSLAEALEPLRQANGGRFTGLRVRVAKESTDQYARYLVHHR